MLRRYQPSAGTSHQNQENRYQMQQRNVMSKAPAQNGRAQGGIAQQNAAKNSNDTYGGRGNIAREDSPGKQNINNGETGKRHKNFLLDFLPPAIYNPETQKILGVIGAEDLLLLALIFVLSESERSDSRLLVYALLYILVSDYIELPI